MLSWAILTIILWGGHIPNPPLSSYRWGTLILENLNYLPKLHRERALGFQDLITNSVGLNTMLERLRLGIYAELAISLCFIECPSSQPFNLYTHEILWKRRWPWHNPYWRNKRASNEESWLLLEHSEAIICQTLTSPTFSHLSLTQLYWDIALSPLYRFKKNTSGLKKSAIHSGHKTSNRESNQELSDSKAGDQHCFQMRVQSRSTAFR